MTLQLISITLLGLFWALFGHEVQKRLITGLKHKYIKGWYDFEKTVQQFTESFIPIYDRPSVFETLKTGLQTIEIDEIQIVDNQALETPEYEEIQTFFKNQHLPILEKNVPKPLTKQFETLTAFPIKIAIPIRSSEILEAVVFLGEKRGGISYKPQDISLFQTLQNQLTIILDRIRPYEEINAQLESTKAYAEQLNRQAAFGKLTAQIAHEVRNPLSILKKSGLYTANALQKQTPEAAAQFLKMADESIDRALRILDTMLEYGNAAVTQNIPCQLQEILTKVLTLSTPMLTKAEIRLDTDLPDLPAIQGDPSALFQVFSNILLNAAEAIGTNGQITVKVGLSHFLKNGQRLPGICVTISDSGPGIPAENLPHIFDYFFSTKDNSRGLGLSIIHKLINDMNGYIEVDSIPGNGTTFRIYLPVS